MKKRVMPQQQNLHQSRAPSSKDLKGKEGPKNQNQDKASLAQGLNRVVPCSKRVPLHLRDLDKSNRAHLVQEVSLYQKRVLDLLLNKELRILCSVRFVRLHR